MKSRFKSNDFFGILIAIILIAIGFVLFFIHKQSTQDKAQALDMSSGHVTTELVASLDDLRLLESGLTNLPG